MPHLCDLDYENLLKALNSRAISPDPREREINDGNAGGTEDKRMQDKFNSSNGRPALPPPPPLRRLLPVSRWLSYNDSSAFDIKAKVCSLSSNRSHGGLDHFNGSFLFFFLSLKILYIASFASAFIYDVFGRRCNQIFSQEELYYKITHRALNRNNTERDRIGELTWKEKKE